VAEQDSGSPAASSAAPRRRILRLGIVAVILVISTVIALPLARYGQQRSDETRCQTNLRWLATSLWLYAQDYSGGLPPPEEKLAHSTWRTWVDVTEPYRIEPSDRRTIEECPGNPVGVARNPRHGYPYRSSYALNRRFFGQFGPGPYPIFNLEIPERTALIVEAGRFRAESPFGRPAGREAESAYWDTGTTPLAYPSAHLGRMNLAAADGHAKSIIVRHYSTAGHDALYGRIGGSIYNWNGGHPNGKTELPPRE
jgi:prepilin-type processing-associated H-X9-DG protein